MKIVVAVLVTLGALAGSASAQAAEKGVFGVGLVIGEPTGISAKLYLDDTTAVQGAVGSAFVGGGWQIHADYVWHPWILEQRESFTLPAYVGPGVRLIDYTLGRDSDYLALGLRAVAGIVFDFTEIPLDVFVEVAGVLEYGFTSDVERDGIRLTANAGAGGRYYSDDPRQRPTVPGGPRATVSESDVASVDTGLAPTLTPAGGETVAATDLVGQTLDRYQVLARLGAGGMGVVYAALDPALDRKVALKVLPPLDDDRRVHLEARLRREAQALARVDHANVVAVYDVGFAAQSVFLAMQLVDGTTLDALLETARPPPKRILELFVAAARGLAAAHAAGIVHRDFKPSNVLVDRTERVYVSDFGLARGAADEDDLPVAGRPSLLDEQMTRIGAVMGTPVYMAPEQHRGEPATAASDQLSFCICLWEALFRVHPFVAGRWNGEAAIRAMESDQVREPPRVSGVPARVVRVLRRGLRHDPPGRWPSMTALIDAIAPRSRMAWVFGGLTIGGLAGGVVLASVLGGSDAGDPCQASAQRLDATWTPAMRGRIGERFLATGLPYAADTAVSVTRGVDAYAGQWRAMRLETCRSNRVRREQSDDLFDRRMRCLNLGLAELDGLIDIYTDAPTAGDVDGAVSAIGGLPAIAGCADLDALLATAAPPSDPAVRAEVDRVGEDAARMEAAVLAGRYDGIATDVERLEREARATGWDPLIAKVLYIAGSSLGYTGDIQASTAKLREAAVTASRAHDDALAARALQEVAFNLTDSGDPDQALQVVDDVEILTARAGDDPLASLRLAAARGYALHQLSRFEEADAAYAEAEKIALAHGPADAPELIIILTGWATAVTSWGKYDRAIELLQRAIAITTARYGAQHPTVALEKNNLANAYLYKGDLAAAKREYEASLAIKEARVPAGNPSIATTIANLGIIALRQGRIADADQLYHRALEMRRAVLPVGHKQIVASMYQIAGLRRIQGKTAEAIAIFEDVLEARIAGTGEESEAVANVLDALGNAQREAGDLTAAQTYLDRALAVRDKVVGPDSADAGSSHASLAELALARGDCKNAVAEADRALAILARAEGDPASRAAPIATRALCLQRDGKIAEAGTALDEALALLADGGDPQLDAELRFALADVTWHAGDHSRAVELATAAAGAYTRIDRTADHDRVMQWLAKHRLR